MSRDVSGAGGLADLQRLYLSALLELREKSLGGVAIAFAVVLHLVRHAEAGNRHGWEGNDFERPLDASGRMQAQAIAEALKSFPVQRILSSPATRCIQTVTPLAEALEMPVATAEEIAEGTFLGDALRLVGSLASSAGDSVLCSHGDVIPGVLWQLSQEGLDIADLGRCKKASIWELHVSDGRVVAAVYRHPRTFSAA